VSIANVFTAVMLSGLSSLMCPVHADPFAIMLSASEASPCEALGDGVAAWWPERRVRLRRMRFASIQRGRPFTPLRVTALWTVHAGHNTLDRPLSASEASNGACPERSEGCEALDGEAGAWYFGRSVGLWPMRFARGYRSAARRCLASSE